MSSFCDEECDECDELIPGHMMVENIVQLMWEIFPTSAINPPVTVIHVMSILYGNKTEISPLFSVIN